MNIEEVMQLLKFYDIAETNEDVESKGYEKCLLELIDIQCKQIERLQKRLYNLEPKQQFYTQPIRIA